jgi:predicted O-methyltransferase YrrM
MDTWVLVPTRYDLNPDTWEMDESKKWEFEYIDFETLKGRKWPEYAERVAGVKLCELMTFQGSCWFMSREYFWYIRGLDDDNYGSMGREAQEVCLKTWLSGGCCVLDRNTYYGHWSKPSALPGMSQERAKSESYANSFWKNDTNLPKLKELYERFAPVPGYFLDKWQDVIPDISRYILTAEEAEAVAKIRSIDQVDISVPEKGGKLDGWIRKRLYEYFNHLGFTRGAEVGVWEGTNAKRICQAIPNLEKLYLVDPYSRYGLNRRNFSEDKNERVFNKAQRKTRNYNVEFIRDLSENAVRQIPDESLDFVYIDGNHKYDFTMLDILLWSRKVKKGGIVSGHDYYNDPKSKSECKNAVNDYTKQHKLELYITDNQAEKEYEGREGAKPSWFFFRGEL